MTVAKCTECKKWHPTLNFDLYSDIESTPRIGFEMPMDDEHLWCEICDCNNVYFIELEDILEEAVLGSIEQDHGEGSHRITKLLRDYADKIDAEAYKNKWRLLKENQPQID